MTFPNWARNYLHISSQPFSRHSSFVIPPFVLVYLLLHEFRTLRRGLSLISFVFRSSGELCTSLHEMHLSSREKLAQFIFGAASSFCFTSGTLYLPNQTLLDCSQLKPDSHQPEASIDGFPKQSPTTIHFLFRIYLTPCVLLSWRMRKILTEMQTLV